MSCRVAVVVVNWDGLHFLERCLGSLELQIFSDFEVVLVDNGSTDGSVSYVEHHFPRVRLICNKTNLGFAAANNQAIRATETEFVVTLNNDTEVEPIWLEELVRVAELDERVGALSSKMLFASRPTMINSAGIALDRAGIAWDWQGGETDDPGESDPVEVFGACAGAAMYRRAMLDDVGLFDERFFAYLEDVDLAWRAQWAGWRALSVPTARVLHYHSGTLGEGSALKNRLLGRNKLWTVVKNYPMPQLLLYLPIVLLYDLGSMPYKLVISGEWSSLMGRLEGLAKLGRVVKERRVGHCAHRIASSEMFSLLSPLASPTELRQRYAHLREEVAVTGTDPSESER